MAAHTGPRITLHPHTRRVSIHTGDTLIAGTRIAIELREHGYPHRPDLQTELPRVGVDMSKLSTSSAVTHGPCKGDTTYQPLPDSADVAWSYGRPIDGMEEMSGRLAFDFDKVMERVA